MARKAAEIEGSTRITALWALAGGVVTVWLTTAGLIVLAFPGWEVRGLFGDSFGAVNSLFSGLAFAGVIFTIHLQRQELVLQRKELALTRTQLARTADAQEQSEKALAEQAVALHEAAYLSALNFLIDHYAIKIQRTGPADRKVKAEAQQMAYIEQLENALQNIESRIFTPGDAGDSDT